MFEASAIMIMHTTEQAVETYKLDVDENTRKAICKAFSDAKELMIYGKEKVVFDGSYKPNPDEFLAVEGFSLCGEIQDAIRNPLGLKSFQKPNGFFPEIQAVFVGERQEEEDNETFTAAFQRFRKDQYLTAKRFNLFFDNNTFFEDTRFGISLSDTIDCCFDKDELQFVSYHFARQVFDLSAYYRSATDQEVSDFAASKKLHFSDSQAFNKMADTWVRRKIASINDSRVLVRKSAKTIQLLAKETGIDIAVKNRRVVIPSDKKDVKVILGFLDEEAYRGPFSQTTYLANSKRRI